MLLGWLFDLVKVLSSQSRCSELMRVGVVSCPDTVLLWSYLVSGSYSPPTPSYKIILGLRVVRWYRCPICGCTFLTHLDSALWSVVSFYFNQYLLFKETSLMRSESYINLKLQWHEFVVWYNIISIEQNNSSSLVTGACKILAHGSWDRFPTLACSLYLLIDNKHPNHCLWKAALLIRILLK